MKFSTLLLAGSVAVNAALVLFLIVSPSSDSTSAPSSSTASARPVTNASSTHLPSDSTPWAAIGSSEFSTQADRLRSEGFPPSAIRAILAAQIREGYADRRKAIEAAQADAPFWKNPTADPKIQAELRALSKLEQQALRDLLGPDLENGAAATLRRQLPGFSPETIEELAVVRDRYNQQRQDIYASLSATTPENRQKAVDLDKAMRAEIAALLTPQEFEDYELRTSNTANSLRNNLVAFEPSEGEFRALFKLQSAFNDQFQIASIVGLSPDQQTAVMRQRSEAQKQLTEEIKATLGAERYTEYQRATDSYYRQTSQLVARLELPVEVANQVYVVQKDLQQRVQSMDRSLTPDSRNAQLAALAAEAQTRISATLGPSGYEAYKDNGGSWLNQLQPRPSPVPGPAPR
ncbi:MAG: hypothetical protein ABIZ81_01515 [Opitutaceae bacterium]